MICWKCHHLFKIIIWLWKWSSLSWQYVQHHLVTQENLANKIQISCSQTNQPNEILNYMHPFSWEFNFKTLYGYLHDAFLSVNRSMCYHGQGDEWCLDNRYQFRLSLIHAINQPLLRITSWKHCPQYNLNSISTRKSCQVNSPIFFMEFQEFSNKELFQYHKTSYPKPGWHEIRIDFYQWLWNLAISQQHHCQTHTHTLDWCHTDSWSWTI